MESFLSWCFHYGYNPEERTSRDDYALYQKNLSLLESINRSAAVQQYHIAGGKGWWKPKGLGYTKNLDEAGAFTFDDMKRFNLNLDGCTLHSTETASCDDIPNGDGDG